jgi:putative phage-type endonuclease
MDFPFLMNREHIPSKVKSNPVKAARFVLTRKAQEDFLESLKVTDEDVKRIKKYEQRTPEWFAARRGRLTGSNIGSVVGHNFFCKPTDKLKELLWSTFKGNAATAWGTKFEPIAAHAYEQKTQNNVQYPGLVVSQEKGYFGYSPDGLFVNKEGIPGLLEIKCPFKAKLYGRIPQNYYDQISFGMWLTKSEYSDFFVWTPIKCSIQRFIYCPEYVETFLLPAAEKFYINRFMPLLLLKEAGMLKFGQVEIPDDVIVEPVFIESAF